MAKSVQQMLDEARERVPEIIPEDVGQLLLCGQEEIHVIDVRDSEELIIGSVPGSFHASRGTLEMQINDIVPDPESKIVLYCASGMRSLFAGMQLLEMGYKNVFSMKGGYHAWREVDSSLHVHRGSRGCEE